MTKTKNTVSEKELEKNLNEFYQEPVPLMIHKDKLKQNEDLTVTVNGVNYQIKRGIPVTVPRCVALAVERSHKQEIAADEYIESLKEV